MKRIKWTTILLVITAGLCLAACDVGGGTEPCEAEAYVDRVEIEAREGDYYAVVTGNYPDACSTMGNVTQEAQGRTIKVTICTTRPQEAMCAQMLTPFEETIQLDVDGLSPGQYTVDVNGAVNTLTLP